MTAVVGILNKQAVAIAADSAVTIGGRNGHKILNKANKLFTLSKQHPVGVMIYNAASFMSTPWETIIKIYRKQLKDKFFPTLLEYKIDFIEFLRSKNFYTDEDNQIGQLENLALYIIDSVVEEIQQNNIALVENPIPDKQQFLQLFEVKIDSVIDYGNRQTEFCQEFADYTFDMFKVYSENLFDQINKYKFQDNDIEISEALFLKVKLSVYLVLRAKEKVYSYTGLIFTGFGEDEIYPQLIPVNISMVVDNRLRYYIDEDNTASISNYHQGAVRPFAQTDVINTILSGIDPNLDNTYLENFKVFFKKYNDSILNTIGDKDPLLFKQIQNLNTDSIVYELNNLNQQIKNENYIVPLMNAVSSLSKEDLAEMAESLIYLTYLKRRITFAEESVGGPVDVAIISKGDGFVWIKRKNYFNPEINQHFFDNYFKI